MMVGDLVCFLVIFCYNDSIKCVQSTCHSGGDMKKLVSVVVVVAVLMATLVSCGGAAIVGKWEGVYAENFGMKVKITGETAMYLEIKSDGTAIGTSSDTDKATPMKWKEEKGVYIFTFESGNTDDSFKATLENDVLVIENESVKLYMSKDAKNFKYPSDVIDPEKMTN